MNMLPPAIAMFTAILKKEGHNVDIFDTTYYSVDHGIDSTVVKWKNSMLLHTQWKKKALDLRILTGKKI